MVLRVSLGWLAVSISAVHAVASPCDGPPADRGGWHEFVVPSVADERTEDSLIDLSFLNPEPAGTHGFLRASDDRIVDGRGRVVRLFGSNICDFHVMPPKEEAPRVARRKRQLGMNFARLHYYDWAPAPQGIMAADNQSLDPTKLDQMDWLIAQLKANGIYVDLNLHVAREYPGNPPGWSLGKSIGYLHEPFIRSQMQFARDILSHVNPYTGRAYADEPALALVELNNENTAMPFWGGRLDRYAGLPDEHRLPLQAKFASFLTRRYVDTEGLRRAWNADPPAGPNLLRNGGLTAGLREWVIQNAEGAQSTAAIVSGPDDEPALRWTATRAGGADWSLQLHQLSVPVKHGRSYTLQFQGRSETGSTLLISLMQQQEPWRPVGGPQSVRLTPQWTTHQVRWRIENPGDSPVRLNLSAANEIGQFELAGLALRQGEPPALPADQTLEDATVDLVPTNERKSADLLGFLHEAELEYFARMKHLIKEELGAGPMLLCTQVDYGGIAGLARESPFADLSDIHAYPAHPDRYRPGWSWAVRQVSLVEDAFGGGFPLGNVACRMAGKPLICSEFDLNPPNHYSPETFLYLAILGSYQGLSGLLDYSWLNFQDGYDHRHMNSSFATTGDAGQMAMIPAAMLMYRLGLIRSASQRLTLVVPGHMRTATISAERLFEELGVAPSTLLRAKLASRLEPLPADDLPTQPARLEGDVSSVTARSSAIEPIVSDTGEILWDRRQRGAETLTVNAPAARVAFGFIVGKPIDLGDVRFAVTSGFHGYANVVLVAMDGEPIQQSAQVLLTTLARVENRDAQWNSEGTAVKWGKRPTVAEPVHMTLQLPGDGWKAQVLDGNGRPIANVPVSGGRLDTEGRGVWYLLTRERLWPARPRSCA